MTYIPASAANWTDNGPNVHPSAGPTKAVTIGVNTVSGTEILRISGESLIEDTMTITGTGKHLVLDGTWDGSHIVMNGIHCWFDNLGLMRYNSVAPTAHDDGDVGGQQSE